MEIDIELLHQYHPELSSGQIETYRALGPLYSDWNTKINVISRKDIDNLTMHHVLHSLSLTRFIKFRDGTKILDLGTGGGFPGIPLAIYYPDCSFVLVDGTAKKIKVVNTIIESLGLTNCIGIHKRAEELRVKFDFVTARAVAPIEKLMEWTRRLIDAKNRNSLPNGLLLLKGGNLKQELAAIGQSAYYDLCPLSKFYSEDYFKEKFIVYIQR